MGNALIEIEGELRLANKNSRIQMFIIFFIFALSINACFSLGNNAEVEALQAQVDALATQNAILLEENQTSGIGDLTGEVDAPAPPDINQDSPSEAVIPTAETLPEGPVPAGTTVIYDGWALTLSNEIKINEDKIHLTFVVRNITDHTKVFRYVKRGVTLQDNMGHTFPFYMASSSCKSNPDNINITQQISLKSGESVNIINKDSNFGFIERVACEHVDKYPPFEGQIDLNADYLVITLNEWGPFNGVVFHLAL